MSGKIEIEASLLFEAMTRPPEWDAWLDVETGIVDMGPDDFPGLGELDEDDEDETVGRNRVEIPRIEGREQYRHMVAFVQEVDEEDVREQLEIALDGRGAFRRFRQVIHRYPDLAARWEQDERDWLLGEARAWLEGEGVDAELRLPPVTKPEAPVAPRRKRRGPRVGLLELVLLGAPGGKTELIDGKVHRRLRAGSPGEARGIFKNVARDLCEFHGKAWRNRFIEGTNSFLHEGAELRIDGSDVELAIAVSPELWKRFEN